jgi:hypothetical protein
VRRRRQHHVRARRPHRLAHPPAGLDPDRDRGCGWARREGGPGEEIRPGAVAWFPPGEDWHGATATTAMTHIAIQEALDGKTVDGMEPVSDEQDRT